MSFWHHLYCTQKYCHHIWDRFIDMLTAFFAVDVSIMWLVMSSIFKVCFVVIIINNKWNQKSIKLLKDNCNICGKFKQMNLINIIYFVWWTIWQAVIKTMAFVIQHLSHFFTQIQLLHVKRIWIEFFFMNFEIQNTQSK